MPFSLSKAAKVTGVSKTTIHKWVKTGKLSATKGSDGTYSIERSELERVGGLPLSYELHAKKVITL